MLRGFRIARVAGEAAKQPRDVVQVSRSFMGHHIPSGPKTFAFRCSASVNSALSTSLRTFATQRTAGRPKKRTATPRTRKTTRARVATSKPAASKKPGRPRKKKAAPRKRARRALTEKQKQAKEVRKSREHVRELKKTALFKQEPKNKPQDAYKTFIQENVAGTKRGEAPISEVITRLAADFKSLSLSEREKYNHIAAQNKAANAAAYKAWVESHSPETIRQANAARLALARSLTKHEGKKRKSTNMHYRQIKDERRVKRPGNAFLHFHMEKQNNGDLHGMTVLERSQLLKQDWAALGEAEKKKYADLAAADKSRYHREFESTYGHAAGA